MTARLRCAIYTRKSTEEGLEQNFNSLHAQREACEAYVMSQAGEGWTAIKTVYDDGGYSGGSMERPALKQLLDDIRRGLVDVVVVYKVDRLTRSLTDFARIVETFDAKGVSFVSVTQAFNTTSSMGRLTLNVLLSFAQFEREVTGERIRDKVAASKAKGLRMGGRPPLGYDIHEGRLVVNAEEAPRARRIFERYLELGNLRALEHEGVDSKQWRNRHGKMVGGGRMTRGAIHYLLTNPAYRGVTRHKEKAYADTHPAIVDAALWESVQAKLASSNACQPGQPLKGEPAPLYGKLVDDRGYPMVPVHTKRGVKRYRYYLSRATLTGRGEAGSVTRLSAGLIEQFLTDRLTPLLSESWEPQQSSQSRVMGAIERVRVTTGELTIRVNPVALALAHLPPDGDGDLRFSFHLQRKRGAQVIGGKATESTPNIDRVLIRGIVLAQQWARELEQGTIPSVRELAQREGMCRQYASRLMPLAYLAPDLVERIITGRQPHAMSLQSLTSDPMPLAWEQQRAWFERHTAER